MKKLIYVIFLLIGTTVSLNSCEKEELNFSEKQFADEDMVWRTPNGEVIPYSERGNWKEYVELNFNYTKAPDKGYKSRPCTTPEISCGLECVTNKKPADCNRSSTCAPCMNCGCVD